MIKKVKSMSSIAAIILLIKELSPLDTKIFGIDFVLSAVKGVPVLLFRMIVTVSHVCPTLIFLYLRKHMGGSSISFTGIPLCTLSVPKVA